MAPMAKPDSSLGRAVRTRRANAAKRVLAGFLLGYGLVTIAFYIAFEMLWTAQAPRAPNLAAGLVYEHNLHGDVTYFSAFQMTAVGVMLLTGVAALLLAAGPPLTELVVRVGSRPGGDPRARVARVTQKELDQLTKRAAVVGALLTPAILLLAGPPLVRFLNAALGFG